MIFTFLVLTYMHEKYILECLESIKYQINNFGNEMKFQIIITDDCSKDKTIELAKFWIQENKNLFDVIDIIKNEDREGACSTLVKGYNLIKGNEYKVIEGDDLFSRHNIFEVIFDLRDYDVICSTHLPFKNNVISKDVKKYFMPAERSIYSTNQVRFLSKVSCPIGGAPVFEKRKLLTEELKTLMLNFKLVGDRPKIYYYFKNSSLKYKFEMKPLILYRHSETSISQNINSEFRKIHDRDIIDLWKKINQYSNNYIIKYINLCNIAQMKFKRRIYIYINPLSYWRKCLRILNKSKINNTINYLLTEIEPNQKYLTEIEKSANYYIKSFIETSGVNDE